MTVRRRPQVAESVEHLFPPALVPMLRAHAAMKGGCLAHVPDDLLVQLLTTVFWAGLETYEGEHRPVGIVFLGSSTADFVTPGGAESGSAPLYQWKILRLAVPRPFAIGELVKLAVAGTDRRIYTAVNLNDGSLVISGLAREGLTVDPDPFVKIVASRPGALSIRSGSDLMLGYERGTALTGGEDVVLSAGPVRRRLEAMARAAELDDDCVPDYVNAVRSLVREMAAHGRGGILIVSAEQHPRVSKAAAYRMVLDSSLASLLQLARHLGRTSDEGQARRATADAAAFRNVLRGTFLTELERVIEELGALTAIDGAVLLNRDLALLAFGVMLPLRRPTTPRQAMDAEGLGSRIIDFGSRGTRHRAGATYAAEHPGSVVFVASEDGELSCMFRDASHERTRLWRMAPADRDVGHIRRG